MRALGEELSAERLQRRELIEQTRSYTVALLESARRLRHEAEAERRQAAAQEADARRLFTSELRSEVHALRTRFELARRDVAADFLQMVGELRAAREMFRGRPERPNKPAAPHAARSTPKPVEVKPAEIDPVEMKAVAIKPAETRFVEIKAAEAKPVLPKAAEAKPVVVRKAAAKPLDVKTVKTAKAAKPAARVKPAEHSKALGSEKKHDRARRNHG